MDEIRTLPCPTCGDSMIFQADQLQVAQRAPIFFCDACDAVLTLTEARTLRRASNADLERQPLGVQELVRVWQRSKRGMQTEVGC